MMEKYFSAKELAGLPGQPGTPRAVQLKAQKESWSFQRRSGRGGGKEYPASALSETTRIALAMGGVRHEAGGGNREVGGKIETKIVPIKKDIIAKTVPAARDRGSIPSWAQKIALARVDLVRQFIAYREGARLQHRAVTSAAAEFLSTYNSQLIHTDLFQTLADIKSVSTLYSWEKMFRESNYDFMALAPAWGSCRRGACVISDDEQHYLLTQCLHQNQIKVGTAIAMTKKILEYRHLPSTSHPSTMRRFIEQFKRTHYDIWVLAREGEKALRDKVAPYLERDDSVLAVGDVLVGDGHRCNFTVINPFTGKPCRPALIGFFDWASRVMCGWSIMLEENVQAIAAALRMAILSLGKTPKYLYLDNGKAFKAKVFTHSINLEECGVYGMFARLGILTSFAWPYNARSKPIERFFGTLSNTFERLLPSFSGASIPDRPASLNRNEKFMVATFSQRIPSIQEVHQWLSSWQGYYLAMPHPNSFRRGPTGQRQTRGQVFESGRGPGVNPDELNYMMMSMEIRTIRQNGIQFMGRHYWNENLYGLKDRVVIKYDFSDLDRVYIYDRNGTYLGRADRVEPVHPMVALAENPQESYTEVQEGIKTQRRLVNSTKKVVRLATGQNSKETPVGFADLNRRPLKGVGLDQLPWDEMIKIDPRLPEKIEKYEDELRVQSSEFGVEEKEKYSPSPANSLEGEGDLLEGEPGDRLCRPIEETPLQEPRFEYPFERYEYLINLPAQTPDQKNWIDDYRTGRIFPGEWQMMYGPKKRTNEAIFD